MAEDTNAPTVIECPVWCARGDEHVGGSDEAHWADTRHVGGTGILADLHTQDGGSRELFELMFGDCLKITLFDHQVAELISVLADLLAESSKCRHLHKTVTLLPD
jgi:hypothetical protein